jgi:hypothetical protein
MIENLKAELASLARIDDVTERQLEAVGIIDEALAEFGAHPVVVGGLAIAYWTRGWHRTGDIDLVLTRSTAVEQRLAELGFRREGRVWVLDTGGPLVMEAPAERLDPHDAAVEVELRSGRRIRVLSPEDMVIWRLREFVHWEHPSGFHQALYLLESVQLDKPRLAERAREEGLTGALDVVEVAAGEIRSGRTYESWEIRELAKSVKEQS